MIDIVIERLLPSIAVLIDQFQPALGILYADAGTAAVLVVLGIVGVLTDECQQMVITRH